MNLVPFICAMTGQICHPPPSPSPSPGAYLGKASVCAVSLFKVIMEESFIVGKGFLHYRIFICWHHGIDASSCVTCMHYNAVKP